MGDCTSVFRGPFRIEIDPDLTIRVLRRVLKFSPPKPSYEIEEIMAWEGRYYSEGLYGQGNLTDAEKDLVSLLFKDEIWDDVPSSFLLKDMGG